MVLARMLTHSINHQKLVGFQIYLLISFFMEKVWVQKKLSQKDWFTIMSLFFEYEQIKKFYITKFSLVGRFALFLTIYFPTYVTQLIGIAPDGFTNLSGIRSALYGLPDFYSIFNSKFQAIPFSHEILQIYKINRQLN